MTVRHLDRLLSPQSIAVVGASDRAGSPGRVVMERLAAGGYEGAVWPVNPKHDVVAGLPSVPEPAALPGTPDLAIVATPAAAVAGVIDALGRAGNRAAVVVSAGLDRDTPALAATLEAAHGHGLRLLGPDSLGLMRPALKLNAGLAHRLALPGRLAFLSQSGAIVGSVVDWAAAHGIGFSHVVALGVQADVGVHDLLDVLATDTESRAILMYLEGIEDAAAFMSAARAAARVKPVIALKSGRHAEGARAATSHTGAMAGTDALFDAAFERAGVLRIHTLEEMFDAAEVLD
ncbi:MAG: CoA-binding protein, partial [Pseudomonadota bacterium]